MSVKTEFGVVREVWLGTVASGVPQYSFLIRDDAYQKSGSKFSSSVALGQPVNLSGNQNWRQDSWEGGVRQDLWNDQAMYMEGSADPDSKKGKLRLWPGWQSIQARAAGSPWIDRYVFSVSTLAPGTTGIASNDPLLWIGESSWAGTTPGAYQLIQYRPGSNVVFGMSHPPTVPTTGPIRTILPMTEADYPTGLLAVTFGPTTPTGVDGKIFMFIESSGVWAQDTNASGNFQPDGGVTYGTSTYWLIGTQLWKRTPAALGFGVLGTWQLVKDVKAATDTKAITVWNNRIYYAANYASGKSSLLVSDGTSTNSVVDWPDNFTVARMLPHYGALYILGWKYGGLTGTGWILQLWRFTGSQLIKLYEEGMGEDNEDHSSRGLTAQGPLLMWGRAGCRDNMPLGSQRARPDTIRIAGSGRARPGIMCYNAETDAIFEGPTLSMDSRTNQVNVTNLYSWNNTVVASFTDYNTYPPVGSLAINPNPVVAAFVRRNDHYANNMISPAPGVGMGAQPLDRQAFALSSVYNSIEPAETKVWLRCRVYLLLDLPGSSVDVQVFLDQSTTPITLATINYDSTQTGYRTVTIPIKANGAGAYLRGTRIQYKLVLHNTDQGNLISQSTPEIDNLDFEYLVAPAKRREWNVRAVCSDAQTRLDGLTPNPLTTAAAMVSQLETMWANHDPVLFYDAAVTDVANTPGVECVIVSFTVSQFRLDTNNPDVVSEVAIQLREVVNS